MGSSSSHPALLLCNLTNRLRGFRLLLLLHSYPNP